MRVLVAIGVVGTLAVSAAPAGAQASEEDRFFIDKSDDDQDKTLWQGSLTSTTFYFAESGTESKSDESGFGTVDNASPFSRLFTDLRLQVDGRHLKGGRWDLRADTRLRLVKNAADDVEQLGSEPNRSQSGLFGRNEYDLRELYVVRGGRRTDVFLGRQLIADLGAVKIDGLRIDYAKNRRWTYLGFLGLYPVRGSRSVKDDYPPKATDLTTGDEVSGRVLPVAGGFGGAYRTQRTYGALGAVAIVPTSRDASGGGNGTFERPRLYVTANGYWRRSSRLDLFHYLIFDLYGSGGTALTNASVGLQWKPRARLRAHLSVNTVDSDALNVQVRDQLADEGGVDGAVVNNLKVQRIAARSARASLTAAFGKLSRIEVTAALTGRRRPAVTLQAGTGTVELGAAQAVELMLQVVDRRSWKGIRLDGSYLRSIGVGSASYARSRSQIFRVGGSRELKDGKAELAGDLSYVATADDSAGMTCVDFLTCLGSANTSSLQATGLAYYRFRRDWYLNGSLGLGTQTITTTKADLDGGVTENANIYGNAFVRLGYRF